MIFWVMVQLIVQPYFAGAIDRGDLPDLAVLLIDIVYFVVAIVVGLWLALKARTP